MATAAATEKLDYSLVSRAGRDTKGKPLTEHARYISVNSAPRDITAPQDITQSDEIKVYAVTPQAKQEAVRSSPAVAQQAEVAGVILDVTDGSISCEMFLPTGSVNIRLSRGLFPDHIRYGLPISLRIEEIGGIRYPVVSVRELNDPTLAQDNARFARLVDRL